MSRISALLLLPLIGLAAPGRASGSGGRPPFMRQRDSAKILQAARAALDAEPESKAKADLAGALSDLEAGAARISPETRQSWIDGHLGDFNEVLRALVKDAPAPLLEKAAKAASRLNGRAERWKDSREFAEQALSRDPDDRDALVDRSRANTGLSDFARGYADAERAARLAPDSADAYTARAAAAYGLGDDARAMADSRRALALDPEDKTAYVLLRLSEGRAKKIPGFEQDEPARIAGAVAREYGGTAGPLNQAEERLRAPVEEPGPLAVSRLVSSSGLKLTVKDYDGAVEDADKALALDPGNARALYFRAAAHNLIGEYDEAARDATRGLALRPDDAPLRDARAWAYNRMGRFSDAVADAHAALESDPRDGYALANRAYADEQRGDYEAMAEDYKAAAALNPQFEPAYADASRRHGLTPRGSARRPPRGRLVALVLASSLLGGLLIALGALPVGSIVQAPRPDAAPSAAIEAAYALGKPIGRGGMGIVYEAYDRKLRRRVAIKMLRDEYKLDDDAKASFLEEARTVAELHHPAIVDIHNIIEDERGLYLVFERLEGRTLDQVLAEKKRLPLGEIKNVLGPVCAALEYAHARDVVHRDLKPSNVMLTDSGVKVLDFGISRRAARAGESATTRSAVGTPHYMAPEQEDGVVHKENDVFSLGAVLYEMLTGEKPYEGPRQAKLEKDYVRASARARGVTPELDSLIGRCLEPDAERRLKSPAEFWRVLQRAVPA